MAGEFDKDFGYLMPFLDKIAGAAGLLAEPAARAELTKLIADEKAKWSRIRDLLGGAAGQAGGAAPAPSGNRDDSPVTDSPAAREPLSFTVGSLRPKRP